MLHVVLALVLAQYAGQQARAIKALSAEEVNAYLKGEGQGLAKAAELNSYPGPKHVLELASQLSLTDRQTAEARRIFDEMHAQAIALGNQIVEKEKALDELFARQAADRAALEREVGEIARLQGQLRVVHLAAHLRMKALLTAEQVTKYNQLRGYAGGAGHQHQHH
jgi:Spy/CpxP family protein refolding chaperone